MTTAREVCEAALRKIGVAARGQGLAAEDASQALDALARMIDGWANEELMVPQVTMESFSISAGTGSYTIGSGQDFNTTLPLEIVAASVRDSAGIDTPATCRTVEQYERVAAKSVQGRPAELYFDRGASTGTIHLLPVPDASYTLRLDSLKPLASPTKLDDNIVFPAGYIRALIYNLSLELAPEYGKTPSAIVIGVAGQSKSTIKARNFRPAISRVDDALLRRRGASYNINSD